MTSKRVVREVCVPRTDSTHYNEAINPGVRIFIRNTVRPRYTNCSCGPLRCILFAILSGLLLHNNFWRPSGPTKKGSAQSAAHSQKLHGPMDWASSLYTKDLLYNQLQSFYLTYYNNSFKYCFLEGIRSEALEIPS